MPEPIVPPALLANRVVAVSVGAGFLTGAAMFGAISFVPLYAGGMLINYIPPELWLLHLYMPHIAEPTVTSDRAHNLGIVSERAEHANRSTG